MKAFAYKRYFALYAFLTFSILVSAQIDFFVNDELIISETDTLFIDGNFIAGKNGIVDNRNQTIITGELNNTGTLSPLFDRSSYGRLANVNNNGEYDLEVCIGNISFLGQTQQQINSDGITLFARIESYNPNDIILLDSIIMLDSLFIYEGNVNLNAQKFRFYYKQPNVDERRDGVIGYESNSNRIIDVDTLSNTEGINLVGYIESRKVIASEGSNESYNTFGLRNFHLANLGTSTFKRYHINDTMVTMGSTQKLYQLISGGFEGGDVSLTLNYFDADLIPDEAEDSLTIWAYRPISDYNLRPEGIDAMYYPSVPIGENDTIDNLVSGSINLSNDYILTLADINCNETPNLALQDSMTVCVGQQTELNPFPGQDVEGIPYFYKWDVPVGLRNDKHDNSVIAYYFTPDSLRRDSSYTIKVNVRDVTGCNTTDSIVVTVRNGVAPVIEMLNPSDMERQKFAICTGDSFYLRDTTNTDDSDTRYTWTFPDQVYDNHERTVFHTLDVPGDTIEFFARYENQYGCAATKRGVIVVHPEPQISFYVNDSLCEGNMVTLVNNTTIRNINPPASLGAYTWKIGTTDSIQIIDEEIIPFTGNDFSTGGVTTSQQSPDLTYRFTATGAVDISLMARSQFGCVSVDTNHFYVNPAVVADFDTSGANNVCAGSTSAFFPNASASRGDDINYTWTFIESSLSAFTDTSYFTFTNSGQYPVELIVTSESGCSDTTIQIVSIHQNAVADFSVENQCLDTNGSITTFQNLSNDADYFEWSYGNDHSDNIGSITYDSAGQYAVSLVANNKWNCPDTANGVLEIYPLPQISFSADTGVCINEQYRLFTNNSTGAENYHWVFGDETFSNEIEPKKRYFKTGVMPVTLTGTSRHICQSSYTQNIVIYGTIDAAFDAEDATVCQGSTSRFNSTSDLSNLTGITWVFGDGNEQYTPFTDPDIDYTYADAGAFNASMITHTINGCTDTTSAIVNISEYPLVEIETEGQTCMGEEIVFSISDISSVENIITYEWLFNDPHNPASNTSTSATSSHFYTEAGIYNSVLNVVSERGCRGTDTLTIQIDSLPVIGFDERTTTCASTLELIAGSVGMDYLWSTGATSPSINIISNDHFSVQVTDPTSGCSSYDETFVELSSEVNPGLPATIEACEQVILDAHNPGGRYQWSNGDTTRFVSISSSGNYWVRVEDVNKCVGEDTVSITINASPSIALPQTISSCEGTPSILDPGASAGTYTWNTGATSQTIEVTSAGYYWVNVIDANGCKATAMTKVFVNPVPNVFFGGDRTVCADELLTISAGNPGSTYSWSNGDTTQALTPTLSGTYSVDVTNSFGCVGSGGLNVQINPLPVADIGGDQSLCDDQLLVLDANVDVPRYYWSTNQFTRSIEVSNEGNFWVRVTDENNCSSVSDIIRVSFRDLPNEPFQNIDLEPCNFTILDAGNPGSTYQWQDGNTSRNFLAENSGLYWVEITNGLGCSLRDSVDLYVKPMAIVNLDDEMEICENASGFIDAGDFGPDYSYQWNTGSTESFIRVTSPGIYAVNVIHAEGCVGVDSIQVNTLASPVVDLGSDKVLCKNAGLTLDGGTPGSTYFWGSTNEIIHSDQFLPVNDTGSYWVYVIAPNECTGTDTINLLHTNQFIEPLFMCASRIRVGDTVNFVDLSVPEPSGFYWDFGDNLASEDPTPSHIYYNEGEYDVSMTVTNSICTATIEKPISVEGFNPGYLIKLAGELEQRNTNLVMISNANVYPNPAADFVTLDIEITQKADVGLFFYSMNGQLVKIDKLDDIEKHTHRIDLQDIRPGLYFLRVVTRNEAKTFKIIVTR
jgi:PKD repeat protein